MTRGYIKTMQEKTKLIHINMQILISLNTRMDNHQVEEHIENISTSKNAAPCLVKQNMYSTLAIKLYLSHIGRVCRALYVMTLPIILCVSVFHVKKWLASYLFVDASYEKETPEQGNSF